MNQILAAVIFTFALNAINTRHMFQEKSEQPEQPEKNPKEGIDERATQQSVQQSVQQSEQQSTEDLIRMNQNIRKYGILQTLENKNVSQHHKLALINEFEYLWRPDTLVKGTNITFGRLYEDWEFEF